MKIGIISFYNSNDNYGQLLQCYALQQVLIERGHEPYHLRYAGDFEAYPLWWNILRKIYFLLFHPIRTYRQVFKRNRPCPLRGFDEFRERHLLWSPVRYDSYRELKEKYDTSLRMLICGSDQIWVELSRYSRRSLAYLLAFAAPGIKRVSYAASFGMNVNSADQTFVSGYLKNFDHISVREKSALDFCHARGVTATLVCDPTLLCSQSPYDKLIAEADTKQTEKSFALCYMIGWKTEFPAELVSGYCLQNSWAVRCVMSQTLEWKGPFRNCEKLTIPDWMKACRDAECIFTNSYHGTIFAIVMHKTFVVFPLKGRVHLMNDRIYTLLEILGLLDRIYNSEKQNFDAIVSAPIDWEEVDRKLEEYRTTSMNYLISCGL